MAMSTYTGETEIITNLGTTPDERGLSTDEFKAKFDEGLKAFVTWFNDTHKTEFDAHLAEKASDTNLGHVKVDGTTITVDENGIISGSGAETSNRTITVGTDKDFTTIQAAIDSIKKRVDADITINVDAGTYAEDIVVNGFIGSGNIAIYGGDSLANSDNYKINSITVKGCSCSVWIRGFRAMTTAKESFTVDTCLNCRVDRCKTIENATSQTGFHIRYSNVYIIQCQSSNKLQALYAVQSCVFSRDWTPGTGNTTGIESTWGSTVGKYGTQPQGTTAEKSNTGGVIRA